jgi:hypothetical protein
MGNISNNKDILDITFRIQQNEINCLEKTDIIIQLYSRGFNLLLSYYSAILLNEGQLREMLRLKTSGMNDLECIINAGLFIENDTNEPLYGPLYGPLHPMFSDKYIRCMRLLQEIGFSSHFTFTQMYITLPFSADDEDDEEVDEDNDIEDIIESLNMIVCRYFLNHFDEYVCYRLGQYFEERHIPNILTLYQHGLNQYNICDILLAVQNDSDIQIIITALANDPVKINTYNIIKCITILQDADFDENYIVRAIFTTSDSEFEYIVKLAQDTNIPAEYILTLVKYIHTDTDYMILHNQYITGWTDWSLYCFVVLATNSIF